MKIGDKIVILPSLSLKEMKLDALVGLTATIVEINGNFHSIKGCWVRLSGAYFGEKEWYIPYNSIGV